MAAFDNADPLAGWQDEILIRSLCCRRPGLEKLLQIFPYGEPTLQQCMPPDSRSNSNLSMLMAASDSSIRTRSTNYTTSTNSMEVPRTAASNSASSFQETLLTFSESPEFLWDPSYAPQPVDLHPVCDPTMAHQSSRTPCGNDTNQKFFCTYCQELHEPKNIKIKSDWKRHETKFHETGEEYHCPIPGCHEIFYRQQLFAKHLSPEHRGNQTIPGNANKCLPMKHAYGCGFCRQPILRTRRSTDPLALWHDRCDHVAVCMQKGGEWSFTHTILALLKQPNIHTEWKKVKLYWCQRIGIHHTALRWHPETSRLLRQNLELNNFGTDLESFLMTVFKFGLQDSGGQIRKAPEVRPTYTQAAVHPSTIDNAGFSQQIPFIPPFHPGNDLGDLSQLGQEHMSDFEEQVHPSKRLSVIMLDAPLQAPEEEAFTTTGPVPGSDYGSHNHFSVNNTPPTPHPPPDEDAIHDHSKASPGKRLLHKSKSWLNIRRSHHCNMPVSLDHPDMPSNYQLPSHRRPSPNYGAYGQGGFPPSFL